MSRLDPLPFHHVAKFDPETHDIWGRAFNDMEMNRADMSQLPSVPTDPGYAYNPADRPAEYPDDGIADHDPLNDTLGGAIPRFDEDGDGGEIPAVSFHDIRSLDHLENYFQRIRTLLKDSKSKYGWCGPNFVRPKTTWGLQARAARKPKVRKEPERMDFTKIDWTDKTNKFQCNAGARTVYDDKIIEDWSTQKVIIPFLGIELSSNYDDEAEPIDFENENDPKYVPAIFKLFISRNRSILDLLRQADARQRNASGASAGLAPDFGDDGLDDQNDIELPRNIVEDFCSQPSSDGGFNRPEDGCAPPESAWQLPSSTPGFLDEPLSAVTGIDSIRFCRKPKPIDMSALKKSILKVLSEKLSLDENGLPLKEEETSIDLSILMFHVLQQIGLRTEKLMSVPIFIVALMHVVADRRLFVIYQDRDPECPVVICRGKNFNHYNFIPMPVGGLGIEME